MLARDLFKLTSRAIAARRLRASLTTIGIALGVAAVVLLTSIGHGVNRFVLTQFTQFGTNIVQITPGKLTTFGGSLGSINTTRPLSIDDLAAARRLPYVEAAVGFVMGNAEVEGNRRQRRTTVYGTNAAFPEAFSFDVAIGTFLPDDDARSARPTVVLGASMRKELFGADNPLGQFVRVGGHRFRVVGVMAAKGQMLGFDLDDTVYVPLVNAMELFDSQSLQEIDILYTEGAPLAEIVRNIERLFLARHGVEDITVTTQKQMMDVLGSILDVLTLAVGGIGAISLVVGGIGIATIMLISVRERSNEVGAMRAFGATRGQVLTVFLTEAAMLAALGGVVGLVVGAGGALLLGAAVDVIPVQLSPFYIALAEATAVLIGLIAGAVPAWQAATMLPVDALRAE